MATENNDYRAQAVIYRKMQADYNITIKQQERVLQTKKEEIANKFHQLLESCCTDFDVGSGTMATPSTISLTNSSWSLTHVSKLETQMSMRSEHFSYSSLSDSTDDNYCSLPSNATDALLESLVNNSKGLPINGLAMCSKAVLTDNNYNYLGSANGKINDSTPCLEKTTPSLYIASTSLSSDNSHGRSSSDWYTKFHDFKDSQVAPECCDLDKELMSPLWYYSDFTVDHGQRKINLMVSNLCGSVKASHCVISENVLTQHVEGKESSPVMPTFIKPKVSKTTFTKHKVSKTKVSKPACPSSSRYQYVPTSCHQSTRKDHFQRHRYSKNGKKSTSKPLASSTMIENSFSSLRSSGCTASNRVISSSPKASSTFICESEYSSGSSHRNQTNSLHPCACSTGSSSSKHCNSSIPQTNSTMIHDDTKPLAMVPCGTDSSTISVIKHSDANLNSNSGCNSVYIWSMYDEENGSVMDKNLLVETCIKKFTRSEKTMSHKPPLPPAKHACCKSISNRRDFDKLCQDYKLHKLLNKPCFETILECVSSISPADDTCQGQALFVKSVCDKTLCEIPKSKIIPRTSTRIILKVNSSGSSTMEACRASLPYLSSVHTSSNNDDQSVPKSISSGNSINKTTMFECPKVPRKSSSSKDNLGASQGSAIADSVFTDSPNTVCSVNIPHNSMRTNIIGSSRVHYSSSCDPHLTNDSNISAHPQVTLLPKRIFQSPVNFSNIKNIEKNVGNKRSVFNVPKQALSLKHLFRFLHNSKSKTPDTKTSIQMSNEQPKAAKYDMQRSQQLLTSKGIANLHREAKIFDKKTVIRKFKKFNDNFRHRDLASHIQTLATL